MKDVFTTLRRPCLRVGNISGKNCKTEKSKSGDVFRILYENFSWFLGFFGA